MVAHQAVGLNRQAVEDLDLAARFSVNVMMTAGNGACQTACARTRHHRGPHRDWLFVQSISSGNGVSYGQDIEKWLERAAGGTLFIDRVET